MAEPRIVSQFSCGAASAVATKLILADYPAERVTILRAWILEEHEDNDRFSADCDKWFGHPITILRDEKYGASVIEVFKRKRYLKGQHGAPCRKALKGDVLDAASLPDDIFVLGYTAEEEHRVLEFQDANNGRRILCPLIERGLMKSDCLAMVERAGIALPAMYLLGYNNNNCRCCVKGGEGYFNRQRGRFSISARFSSTSRLFASISSSRRFRSWSTSAVVVPLAARSLSSISRMLGWSFGTPGGRHQRWRCCSEMAITRLH